MDEFARSIFENAILREQLAQKIYSELSIKAESIELRDLFQKLAQEEQIHESLFSKFKLETLKIVNKQPLNNLSLLKDVHKDELYSHQVAEINNVLDFAINEEQKAIDDYSLLIKHLDFGEARQAFKEMILQEKRHKKLLQKTKLKFNDDCLISV